MTEKRENCVTERTVKGREGKEEGEIQRLREEKRGEIQRLMEEKEREKEKCRL